MIISYRHKSNLVYKKIYNLWKNMTERCTNPQNPYYKNYGGKGVKICDEWLMFDNFIRDIDSITGFDLDKLLKGEISLDKDFMHTNLYSLKTCKFLSREDNNKIKPNQQVKFIAISPSGKESIWNNQSECARINNLNQSKISECLKNNRKTHKGWKFILFDESCNDYPGRE